MVWYYIVGSGVVLYGLFGVYKCMTWLWQAISGRIKKPVLAAKTSTGPHDFAVDIDPIIPPSPSYLRRAKRVPSFNRAFSCPAGTKPNGLFQQNEIR